MLHEFLTSNDQELARRCHAKVMTRMAPRPVMQRDHGIVEFIRQLIRTLRAEQSEEPQVDATLPTHSELLLEI